MGTSKPIARIALLLIVTLTYAADKRAWKQGTLISVDKTNKVEHRYECVVSDGGFSYTMEYEHPIKAAVHHPIKFVIEKDTLYFLTRMARSVRHVSRNVSEYSSIRPDHVSRIQT